MLKAIRKYLLPEIFQQEWKLKEEKKEKKKKGQQIFKGVVVQHIL